MNPSSKFYISTRDKLINQSFSKILLEGLAPDGGLYLPECYPRFSYDDLEIMRSMGYQELAFMILSQFISDIPPNDLEKIVTKTYDPKVFCHARTNGNSEDITPLQTLEPGLHLLCLSNGPTLAFKDVAMQLLGNLFEYTLEKTDGELNILGATSGDTGSAAEYAMRGKKNIRVFMLSPMEGMSEFQKAQMYSIRDENIFNIVIRGKFDDAQDMVKAVSGDFDFKKKYHIGAVNSINWARIMAQIVYYFKGYLAATKTSDQKVSFSVPSGNFGNICAGHIARMMGLPIHRLIVATNENDVLNEFFRYGVYRPRSLAETYTTSSPSMDISKASNFERFIFDLIDRDSEMLCRLWGQIETDGSFNISETLNFRHIKENFGLISGSSSHNDRLESIRDVYNRFGIIIDPHTADGYKVGQELRDPNIPLIILETAQGAKFEETINEALVIKPYIPEKFRDIEKLPQRLVELLSDNDVITLKKLIVAHSMP